MDTKTKITQLEQICEAQPSDHLSQFLLGRELIRDGQHDRAAAHFARCLQLKPDYTAAYRHWGDALRFAGHRDEAIDAYEKGIAVSEETGDLQAGREMRVFLDKLRKKG